MSDPRANYEVVDTDASLIVSFDGAVDHDPPPDILPAFANEKNDAAGFIVDEKGSFLYYNELNELVTPPMLPSGQVIDSKNTLQSFVLNPPSDPSFILANMKRSAATADVLGASNLAAIDNTARNTGASLCIAEAVAVESNSELNVTGPVKHSKTNFLNQSFNVRGWMIVAFIIVVAIAVTVGVLVSRDNESTMPLVSGNNESNVPPGEIASDIVMLTELINKNTLSEKTIFMNGTSAESKALAWIIQQTELWNGTSYSALSPDVMSDVNSHILQLYALAVLWYQQADASGGFIRRWRNGGKWLQDINECNWFGIQCQNNSVTEIDFYDEDSIDFESSSNNIGGAVPSELGLLASMQHLDFGNNDLTGSLPSSIGMWTNLAYLRLDSNKLTGSLPESFGSLTELTFIDISNNQLSGTLPGSIGQWSALLEFNIDDNDIVGILPEFIGLWINLLYFGIRGNSLNGGLPKSIGQWTALTHFDVLGNNLNGTIPESIVNWTKLRMFNIGSNIFSGALPSLIGQWTDMLSFIVDSNELTGLLPESIGNWTGISSVWLNNNSFIGSLPTSIGNWENIQEFYIHSNMLNGTLPQSLGNWSSLSSASFSGNDFTGIVPPELCTVEYSVVLVCNLSCSCCEQACP